MIDDHKKSSSKVPHKLTIEHEKFEYRCTKYRQGKDLIYKGYNTNTRLPTLDIHYFQFLIN